MVVSAVQQNDIETGFPQNNAGVLNGRIIYHIPYTHAFGYLALVSLVATIIGASLWGACAGENCKHSGQITFYCAGVITVSSATYWFTDYFLSPLFSDN